MRLVLRMNLGEDVIWLLQDKNFEFSEELYIMKVIFLDIDGVLNSNFWNDTHQREISDWTLIDEEKVMLLGQLIRNTSAKVILHSGWKF